MPSNTTLPVPSKTWTRVTFTPVTALRLQHRGPYNLVVQVTAGVTPPSAADGSVVLAPLELISTDQPLSSLWPGVSGADTVWVWADAPAEVSVSHA